MTGPGPDHDLEALLTGTEPHEPGTVDWAPHETPRPGPPNPATAAPASPNDPEDGHPT